LPSDGSTDNIVSSHRSSTASIVGTGTARPDDSEIKDFQKMLINLPIYEVDTHCSDRRDDAGGGLSMSRFSSVPDQLEYLHVLSAQLIDKGREPKDAPDALPSSSTAAAAGKDERDRREADTVPALPSNGRRGEAGGGGGSRRRHRGLASTSSTSSRESTSVTTGVGATTTRCCLLIHRTSTYIILVTIVLFGLLQRVFGIDLRLLFVHPIPVSVTLLPAQIPLASWSLCNRHDLFLFFQRYPGCAGSLVVY